MDKITILAPAKINLFLDVGAKRDDGYHDLLSVMQTVGIFDRITVQKRDAKAGEKHIDVIADGCAPIGEENIAYLAAKAFFGKVGTENYDIKIDIEKKIPMQAGLGGGSSDAAATLIALNGMYGEPMSTDELISLGMEVGSDVPFLVKKGTCLVSGKGETVISTPPSPDFIMTVAVPHTLKISTAQAYSKIDEVKTECDASKMTEALEKCDIDLMCKALFNKFELIPDEKSEVPKIKEKLVSLGAKAASMSGSGSAVFGIFDSVPSAKSAAEALSDIAETFVCAPARRYFAYIEND